MALLLVILGVVLLVLGYVVIGAVLLAVGLVLLLAAPGPYGGRGRYW